MLSVQTEQRVNLKFHVKLGKTLTEAFARRRRRTLKEVYGNKQHFPQHQKRTKKIEKKMPSTYLVITLYNMMGGVGPIPANEICEHFRYHRPPMFFTVIFFNTGSPQAYVQSLWHVQGQRVIGTSGVTTEGDIEDIPQILTGASSGVWNVWDLRYWRCILKKTYECPDNDIRFYLYTQ
ncbi:hypothetical protein NQ318_009857 [Aromia moschata]|uniref:Uncharacterized protein n=1 Tax=Aromia moschata TaxID=1265417 RepID=A0AAV8XGU6_9CUCU|nr:hypothetical protein NQ318_009857 [Aromia moschata]